MNYITKTELCALLDELASRQTLIAPREMAGVTLYRPVDGSAEIEWTFTRPALSVKEAFFPATDRLLNIQKTAQEIALLETLPEGESVVYGVRPCDARGMKILDAVFLDVPVDPYYEHRRQNTALIGLACRQMGETCFCTSMGGSTDDPQDMDLMLTEIEDGYLVQVVTEKGRALIGDRVRQAPDHVVVPPVVTSAPSTSIPSPQSIEWRSIYNAQYWERLADRCLSCRICGYACPTCRCFIVRDEALPSGNGKGEFERIRCWDTCTSPGYRRVAGGHNPRAAKGQRLRNRFFCKFYYYPEQYGPMACTGCGRCIEMCPVNIDITEILSDLAEVPS